MILVRFVCQAKFGKASDVVAGFKRSNELARTVAGPNVRVRLLTDLSGAFDTTGTGRKSARICTVSRR